ncbi:MAG: DNA (cytosine-5-)-methyltransferase [Burkholderiales bacterium RIFCSPLOWO2_02_FULL_57_36]|nr:MAG: DNA (cytosine-5-)-methyltransferase [Burkholderiales bacterium RIFCSPLOWO2_02_FULL_57_36]
MQLLERAKTLRSEQTEAEQRLWYYLRAHRFMDMKFKRQKPIGRYIVDFVCHESRLIVEVDGGQHQENAGYDRRRDTWLQEQGYIVLRFWNHEVMQQIENVLEAIRLAVERACSLSPDPSPASGRGEQSK